MPIPLINIADYEARARETYPRAVFEPVFGAYGQPGFYTNTANLEAFDALKLAPRVLVGGSHRDLSTEVLGQHISFPVMLAPTGFHQGAHPDGELASAQAAGSMGTIMGLSTASTYSIEEVAEVATAPLWFQLYFMRDRGVTENLVRRADRAGYTGLILTVDSIGATSWVSKERDHRYSHTVRGERILKNFDTMELPNAPNIDNFHEEFEVDLKWSDVAWLRSITSMPLVIKGIQTAEDARLCVENGMDGLIVSNHGGHAVQCTRGTAAMLPEVMDAVGDRLEVFIDGGIRRGTDVLKAVALGAKAVFIGRAVFWGLSVNGQAGVRHVLEILRDELESTMGLCGVTDIKNVDRSLVVEPNGGRQGDDVVGQLERMVILLERGYLTREEFEARKVKLLAS